MPVLGKIGLVNRGTYSASATYTALDFVLYNGSSYVALKSVKGVTPSNDGTNWQTLAEGTAAAMYLENSLTYATSGQRALDAAQGPAIKALIDAKASSTDVPPKNHASTATTYGQGNASNFGHVKTTDTYSTKQASAAAANGIVPSQNALYNAYANRAPISHASTGTTYGQGNASNFGHVKLSDTYATKQSSAAAANGVAASQNALYNTYASATKTKVLWSGANYMNANQTIALSEGLIDQPHGVVLHFQAYQDKTVQNYDHVYYYVPKTHGATPYGGSGVVVFLIASDAAKAGYKYLYIANTTIIGNAHNAESQREAGCGIIIDNSYWVLTQVLGV